MDSTKMTVAALGRPFTLGMLYDAHRDELIPGVTLWDHQTMQENTVERPHKTSEFKISTSDTTESKSSLMDVKASLKVSFIGGLVEVGGSAKYLQDQKKSVNQSRVTFQYKTTTNLKELSISAPQTLDENQINTINKNSATHVVTHILYGANAFFVFDSEKLDARSVQEITLQMKAVINKICPCNPGVEVNNKLTDEENKLTEKFSCKFYGDFVLESNPSTFVDAVKTYVTLPKLLGENGENTVPMKVWLLPLKNLYPEAPGLVSEISVGLVKTAQDTLDDLREMEIRCNDSLVDEVVKNFPEVQKQLKTFQDLCRLYRAQLQWYMKMKLPSIREGKEDPYFLYQHFEDREKSPFNHDQMENWLDCKEREINIIRSCVDMMGGTKIVRKKSELDREVLAPHVVHALCFVFTSLEKDDPYIDEMKIYLEPPQRVMKVCAWYDANAVRTKVREQSRLFHNLAKALKSRKDFLFLVAAIANPQYTGATLYQYRDGNLVTEDFSQPDIPPLETITDRRDLIWYARHLTVDLDTVSRSLTLSEENKKVAHVDGESHDYPNKPERFTLPQCLCQEKLTGRSYWEVVWSGSSVDRVLVGVASNAIERDSDLFKSDKCWGLAHRTEFVFNNVLKAYHKKKVWKGDFPNGFNKVGVFLDRSGGTLSFYKVIGDALTHQYTFHTKFTDPVYPAFALGKGGYISLCPID